MSAEAVVARRMAKGKISPKTILAASLPAAGGVLAIAIQWVVTGELNRPELVTALTAFGGAVLAGVGAWAGQPGEVDVELPPSGTTFARPIDPIGGTPG
jgi:hypothetical protein